MHSPTLIPIIIYMLAVSIALCGWGLFVNQLANLHNRSFSINLTLGLGVFVFLGGILNLANIAYGLAFDSLLLIGIAMAVKYAGKLRSGLPKNKGEWIHLTSICLVVSAIMVFTIKTQLSPKAYNFHDDFGKYFAHPVRMLQTGTLFGSPLSAIGAETMGGQAVLQGLILAHFPISCINGMDAVFGLLVCLMLSASMKPRSIILLPTSIISLLIVFFINPQYVNISSLYIATAIIMVAILLSSGSITDNNGEESGLPPPLVMGLVYATPVALKSIFILLPILHIIFFATGLKLSGVKIKRLTAWCAMTTGFSLLFISPWLFLHFPHYGRLTFSFGNESILTGIEFPQLFSTKPLLDGSSPVLYTLLNMAILFFTFISIILKRNKGAHQRNHYRFGEIAGGATIIASYLLITSTGSMLNGYENSFRYTTPYLIAGTPIIFGCACRAAIGDGDSKHRPILAVLLITGISILILFSSSLSDRIQQARRYGSILAFPHIANRNEYLEYNREVLHGDVHAYITALQNKIPTGDELVVWITTPFHLDYKRNIIYDADPAGIANPWAYIPNAEYFMLEYEGFAVRPFHYFNIVRRMDPARHERHIADKSAEFLLFLHNLKSESDEIHNDGRVVIFKKRKAIQ